MGSRLDARQYCEKLESRAPGTMPVTIGTFNADGVVSTSKRLLQCKSAMDSGVSTDDLANTDFEVWVKHGKRLLDYHGVRMRLSGSNLRRLELKVSVLWGRTGCGKTKGVYDLMAEKNERIYKLDGGNNIWWDGYMGEKTILIDDFYGWIKFGFLLNILDVYPLRLEVKGGFTYACWTQVYITSNKPWEQWYKDLTHEQEAALKRRIHEVKIYD